MTDDSRTAKRLRELQEAMDDHRTEDTARLARAMLDDEREPTFLEKLRRRFLPR